MSKTGTDWYLQVKLETDNDAEVDTSLAYLENNIRFSLKSVFGEVGAALPFSVLQFSSRTRQAVVRCSHTGLVKLRTALTLQRSYQGAACCYTVCRASPSLLALSHGEEQ